MSYMKVKGFLIFCHECGFNATFELNEGAELWVGEMEILRQKDIREHLGDEVANEHELLIPMLCDQCSVPLRSQFWEQAMLTGEVAEQAEAIIERAGKLMQLVTSDRLQPLLPSEDDLVGAGQPKLAPLWGLSKNDRTLEINKLAAELMPDETASHICEAVLAANPSLAQLFAEFDTLKAEHPEPEMFLPTELESLAEIYLVRHQEALEGRIVLDPITFARDVPWPEEADVDEQRVWRRMATDWDTEVESPLRDLESQVLGEVARARRRLAGRLRKEIDDLGRRA